MNLEKFNYEIMQAEEEHLPIKKVSLSEIEYENITKFIRSVQGIPDIIEVYDNIA